MRLDVVRLLPPDQRVGVDHREALVVRVGVWLEVVEGDRALGLADGLVELAVVNLARAVDVPLCKQRVVVGLRPLHAQPAHGRAELLLVDGAIVICVPIAEEVHHADGIGL